MPVRLRSAGQEGGTEKQGQTSQTYGLEKLETCVSLGSGEPWEEFEAEHESVCLEQGLFLDVDDPHPEPKPPEPSKPAPEPHSPHSRACFLIPGKDSFLNAQGGKVLGLVRGLGGQRCLPPSLAI